MFVSCTVIFKIYLIYRTQESYVWKNTNILKFFLNTFFKTLFCFAQGLCTLLNTLYSKYACNILIPDNTLHIAEAKVV